MMVFRVVFLGVDDYQIPLCVMKFFVEKIFVKKYFVLK